MTGIINTPLLLSSEGYQISRSVRLRASATPSLSRTVTSASSRTTWTWSGWVKRGKLTSGQGLFAVQTLYVANPYFRIALGGGDTLNIVEYNSAGTLLYQLNTTAVLRDVSAWYHLVVVFDSTNATSTERIRIYINGIRITTFNIAIYPALNQVSLANSIAIHQIGKVSNDDVALNLDGYITELNFIDGQALTPSSFGEFDASTGVWKPKKYTGTYGTNGFYLNFSDNSAATAAAIGKDYSGNGNNWTPNNISVTAGATYDSMLDVPTPWADGGNGRGNYAVINPLSGTQTFTVSNANLSWSVGALNSSRCASFGTNSLKCYFEVTGMAASSWSGASVVAIDSFTDVSLGTTAQELAVIQHSSGILYSRTNATLTSLATSATATDIIQFAFDPATGKVWIGKNNVWFSSGDPAAGTNPYITLTAGLTYTAAVGRVTNNATTATGSITFGQRPFTYTPPTGFKALNTQNLPDATIKKGANYMAAATYTGNASTLKITTDFPVDFSWQKGRSNAQAHYLQDTIRGISAGALRTNDTAAEGGVLVYSFDSDGVTFNANANTNTSGYTYVAWLWKANGAPVSNTTGSITSQVSAGVLQGISIATYTGTGANATVGHGLGVAPEMIIIKQRNNTVARGWPVYQVAIGNTKYLNLESTAATVTNSNRWNNTTPTSSVFTIGSSAEVNESGKNFVAYSFSEVEGFSKFGSYTGNGSADGPFVYCGFRPRFVMFKRTEATGNWKTIDTARDISNVAVNYLYPNLSNAESAGAAIDFTSNGFKHRGTDVDVNASGGTYIYIAFAENPFKNSLAR